MPSDLHRDLRLLVSPQTLSYFPPYNLSTNSMDNLIVPGPANDSNDFVWSTFMVDVQLLTVAYEIAEIFNNFPEPDCTLWEIFWNRVEEMIVSSTMYYFLFIQFM